jgi:predicted P-loop ATPase
MSEIRQFPLVPVSPPGAEDHARAETQRNQALFTWADRVLEQLGLTQAIAAANIVNELRKILLDLNRAEVQLAIRDALHPASGQKAAYFAHLKEGGLKRILKMRFDEAKADRVKEIGRGAGTASSSSAPDWSADLILDKDGAVLPVLANLIKFLRWHPAWRGVLGFDEFHMRVVIRKPPPWGSEAADTPWVDHHESLVRVWLQHEDLFATLGDVGRAVQAAARHNPFHPVRDYFDALVWDGTPRLDTWLQSYFHVEDSDYVRAIGPRFLISAVARVFTPGCQADHTLILEGPQGRLKSEALRVLAIRDEWFTDRLSHVSSKDAALETLGVLIIELAELDALMRASSSASKSFLTRRYDRLRPPYGRHQVRQPRQCIFAGTINPPATGYLRDPTGGRRVWPVTVSWANRP